MMQSHFYFYKELELLYYLLGLECDIVKTCVPVLSHTMKRIVLPEVSKTTKLDNSTMSVIKAFALSTYISKIYVPGQQAYVYVTELVISAIEHRIVLQLLLLFNLTYNYNSLLCTSPSL